MTTTPSGYQLLREEGKHQGDDQSHVFEVGHGQRDIAIAKRLIYLALMLFLTSSALLIAVYTRVPSHLQCAKRNSPWCGSFQTPVEEQMLMATSASMWDAVAFWEGDLTNYWNHSSIYRGPPTAEREQAWEELWHCELHRASIPQD